MRGSWLFALMLGCGCTAAADITVSNGWSRTLTPSDLQAGAGSDFIQPIESAAGVAEIEIGNTGGQGWRVRVAKGAGALPGSATIAVRRSNTVAGVSGGTDYLTLDGSAQEFFTGNDDRSAIQIQIKVEGVDIHAPPDAYLIVLTYSVETL